MVGDNPYVTAFPPSPPSGRLGDVGFAAKTDAARPRRRFGVQLSEINEGGHAIILRPGPKTLFDRETLYAQTLRTDHANVTSSTS